MGIKTCISYTNLIRGRSSSQITASSIDVERGFWPLCSQFPFRSFTPPTVPRNATGPQLGRDSRHRTVQTHPRLTTHLKIDTTDHRPISLPFQFAVPTSHLPPAAAFRFRSPPKTPQSGEEMPLPPLLPRARRVPAALLVPARGLLEARVPWARDRALDHAVEREKHLVPFLLTKDALLAATAPPHAVPLHSLPSTIPFPFRPLRFLQLYPSAFALSPHPIEVSPTPRLAALHAAEAQVVDATLPDAADRLLRLLMLAPSRALPLRLVARLRLDLGLASDFQRLLLPSYPDYFALSPDGSLLELVCYRKDLAVSAMQAYAQRTGGYKVGDAVAFPLSFPRGFDLDKKVRKWLDEWQRLPYISPYEDGSHLAPRSDITEKRTVAVLHEVLSLTVGKKMEKEALVKLGEALRLPPGFRRVVARHPGIFYISHKLRTQTVVLRESYRRQMLVDKHPMMGIRYQYMHLMHMGKEEVGKGKGKDRRSSRSEQDMGPVIAYGEEFGAAGEDDENEEYDDEDDEDEVDEEDIEAGIASEDQESDDDVDEDMEG